LQRQRSRLGFIHETHVASYTLEIAAMLVGGIAAAWVGAGLPSRTSQGPYDAGHRQPTRRCVAVLLAIEAPSNKVR
jgi:hypothetical protein